MKKGLKIALIVMTVLAFIVGIVLACCQFTYLEYKKDYMEFKDNVLGKTSAVVEQIYGKFDWHGMPRGENGLFQNCQCYYIVIEERVGYLGTEPPYIMVVNFDQNGVAYSVSFEQGGWGG